MAIFPTSGNDTITGTGAAESISALAGNDTVRAGGGDDAVNGDAGNDRLFGEDGNDRLAGGPGNDEIDGGAGTDTVVFRDQPGFADCDTLSLHGWEAPFCCSMRLAEGLWYAQVNRAMLYCEQELAEDGTPLVRQDQYGRYMCGDYVLAEPSLPEGVAEDWKLPAPLAVTDGHRLSPLVRFYEIPASVAAVLRQRVLF